MTTLEKLEELIYKGFKETDRELRETDRKIRESSLETDRKIRESSLETDREIRKLSEKVERVSEKVERVSENVAKITDALGRFAENMVAPAVVKLFNKIGIPITDYSMRTYSEVRNIEYDIVAFNKNYVVVVSVKMTLRVNDVKEFLNKRLPIFKEVFPRYKDMRVLGAVAGANLLGKSDIYAMKHGLYVLTQSGENITMLNDEKFKAKVF